MKNLIDPKILIADSQGVTSTAIKQIFEDKKENIIIYTFIDGTTAIDKAWKIRPDLMIVEDNLKDIKVLDVLGILKKNKPTAVIPFIMVANEPNTEQEIKALQAGVDDYITKPFCLDVLHARIKAVLKRALNMNSNQDKESLLKLENISLDLDTYRVLVDQTEVDLTPKEFALLYLFLQKPGRVLTRDYLCSSIWEKEYFQTSHTIDKHIANLRKKLGKQGKCITTVHSLGYKFIA